MVREVQSYSVHDALRFMERAGFTHIEQGRDIRSGPLFYVLHERIRKAHPKALVPMRPNIAHIRNIDEVASSGDMWKVKFKGLFGYWGLQEGTGERIYLGGGNVENTGSGRERQVFLNNCFTSSDPSLENYFPLDEQAGPVRAYAHVTD